MKRTPSSLDHILDRFDARPAGDMKWEARCPAHDDRKASLSIGVGDDGKVLIYCHAGCELADVMAELEMTEAVLFDRRNGSTPLSTMKAKLGPISETYAYTDEDGCYLFEVVRYENPKTFRQRHKANGRNVWNLDGVGRVLFNLPSVIDAVANGRTVYVAEGEKDVLRLNAEGEVATTAPQGAANWHLVAEHAAEVLSDADVVVIADRDAAGYRYAIDVVATLKPVARSVRVVEAAEGNDAAEHLAAGHIVSEFVEIDPAERLATTANGNGTKRSTDSADSADIAANDEWEQPVPLARVHELPAFPSHCLPTALHTYVEALAEFTQTPVDLPSTTLLAVLATAAGGNVKVDVGWLERAICSQ